MMFRQTIETVRGLVRQRQRELLEVYLYTRTREELDPRYRTVTLILGDSNRQMARLAVNAAEHDASYPGGRY